MDRHRGPRKGFCKCLPSRQLQGERGFPRSEHRGRIETSSRGAAAGSENTVSPGLNTGGGLKQAAILVPISRPGVSPGLNTGGGLKHIFLSATSQRSSVSPGLNTGGGLKPCSTQREAKAVPFPPV